MYEDEFLEDLEEDEDLEYFEYLNEKDEGEDEESECDLSDLDDFDGSCPACGADMQFADSGFDYERNCKFDRYVCLDNECDECIHVEPDSGKIL